MRKVICFFAISVLTAYAAPPLPTLGITPIGSGELQIIVSIPLPPTQPYTVLQSSTNLVNWVSIATNKYPSTLSATNIVQSTNPRTFYRAYLKYGTP
jgi:hypothetical protein